LEVETAFHVAVGAPSSTKVRKFLENVTKIQKKGKSGAPSSTIVRKFLENVTKIQKKKERVGGEQKEGSEVEVAQQIAKLC
jgi:hypothetical protein